jgi:hypothetical protein
MLEGARVKEMPLTKGKVALVDDEDYIELSKYKWGLYTSSKNLFYATRHDGQKTIAMHRAIMNTPAGMETDHINGNGLDNRKENLRIVTRRENQQNRHGFKTSNYPGVSKVKNRWTAHIHINKKQNYLGSFKDEEKAARRYRIACDWQVIDL